MSPNSNSLPTLVFYYLENEERLMLENKISDDENEKIVFKEIKLPFNRTNISKNIMPLFCLDPDIIYVDQVPNPGLNFLFHLP